MSCLTDKWIKLTLREAKRLAQCHTALKRQRGAEVLIWPQIPCSSSPSWNYLPNNKKLESITPQITQIWLQLFQLWPMRTLVCWYLCSHGLQYIPTRRPPCHFFMLKIIPKVKGFSWGKWYWMHASSINLGSSHNTGTIARTPKPKAFLTPLFCLILRWACSVNNQWSCIYLYFLLMKFKTKKMHTT